MRRAAPSLFAQLRAHVACCVGAGVLLTACTDDVLLLGAKPEAVTKTGDASDMQDASETPEGDAGNEDEVPPPLRARFKANGRLGVVRVETGCHLDCVDVTVVVEGGVPPYDIVWDDGKVGASQTLCEERSRVPSVVVSDARPGGGGRITLGLNTIRSRNCGTSGEGFLTCFVPERRQVECAGGRREVFELGEPVGPGRLLVELEYESAGKVIFVVDATFSETFCREEAPIAGWQLTLSSRGSALSGSLTVNSLDTGQFLSFGALSGLPIVPTVEDSLDVTWIEICEQATTP